MTYMYTKELESTNKTNNEIVKNSLEYICSLKNFKTHKSLEVYLQEI